MPDTAPTTNILKVRLRPRQKRWLAQRADIEGTTISDLVKRMIERDMQSNPAIQLTTARVVTG